MEKKESVTQWMEDPKTDRTLNKKVVKILRSRVPSINGKKAVKDLADLTLPDFTPEEVAVLERFNKMYERWSIRHMRKPVVKGGLGFVEVVKDSKKSTYSTYVNGGIDAADVWSYTRTRLFQSGMLRFDFDEQRVGRGAFRAYLSLVIRSVYRDLRRKDLVALRVNGKVVYQKDNLGNVMRDSKGRKMPVLVPRNNIVDNPEDVGPKQKVSPNVTPGGLPRPQLTKQDLKSLLDIYLIAYLKVLSTCRAQWFIDAIGKFVEEGVTLKELAEELLKKGLIKKRTNLDVQLKRLRDNVACEASILREHIRSAFDEKSALECAWSDLVRDLGSARVRGFRAKMAQRLIMMEESMG